MSYKLYLDKSEEFICEIQIKNASLKNAVTRLIVESIDGPTLVFKGEVSGNKCIIPIKRLKGLIDENTHGNISLEVIVEDTYFVPWKDTFSAEEHTSVKVKVDENKQSSNKPIVKIKSISTTKNNKKQINEHIESECKGHLGWKGDDKDTGISHGLCNSCMIKTCGEDFKDVAASMPDNVVKNRIPPSFTNENLKRRKKNINIFVPKKEIATICEQFGIVKRNFNKKQKEFIQILKEYFKANPEYNYHTRSILSGIDDFLR